MKKQKIIVLIVLTISLGLMSFAKLEVKEAPTYNKSYRAFFFNKSETKSGWTCHYTAGLVLKFECSQYDISNSVNDYARRIMNNDLKYTPAGNYSKGNITYKSFSNLEDAEDWVKDKYSSLKRRVSCAPKLFTRTKRNPVSSRYCN